MNTKALVLSLANAALYLVTCALIGTGLLLELRMDEEDGAVRLLGMGQDDWGEIHLAIAIAFGALVLTHLVLHWPWIKAGFGRSKSAMLVLIVGLVLATSLLVWPTTSASASIGEQLRHFLKDDD